MEIYSLTGKGRAIAKSVRLDRTKPEAKILDFLYKHQGSSTDDNIKTFIPEANSMLLSRMCQRGYLSRGG